MNWEQAIAEVTEHVVRIETPTTTGTGFLAFYNADSSWCAIATAAHVVKHADDWQQPLKFRNRHGLATLQPNARAIYLDPAKDSAIVLFLKGDLQLPQTPIAMRPMDSLCNMGATIGWLGYPTIAPDTLCFFSGRISARHPSDRAYFVDGVAIHGVSGGPVFHLTKGGGVEAIGAISSYIPNLTTGQSWPGLLIATDVSQFHDTYQRVKNIDEANAAKARIEANLAASAGTAITSTATGGDGMR
jgi:hypothetical protein